MAAQTTLLLLELLPVVGRYDAAESGLTRMPLFLALEGAIVSPVSSAIIEEEFA